MIAYNPKYIENINIFTEEEKELLNELSKKAPLFKFLNNPSYINKFGIDFIYTSAKLEGNTYTKNDTITLIEYGRTAGGKRYSDAKMILNMRKAYELCIKDNLLPNKQTLKNLHYILSEEMVTHNERGTPRNEEVLIAGSKYVPLSTADKLNDEVNYMFSKYEKINDAFDKAIYLHCNLAYLQYFKDCNKRTARMMLNVSLKYDGEMLYIPNEENITNYLSSMVCYYETGNYDSFKKYFINEYRSRVEDILSIDEIIKSEVNMKPREKETKNNVSRNR